MSDHVFLTCGIGYLRDNLHVDDLAEHLLLLHGRSVGKRCGGDGRDLATRRRGRGRRLARTRLWGAVGGGAAGSGRLTGGRGRRAGGGSTLRGTRAGSTVGRRNVGVGGRTTTASLRRARRARVATVKPLEELVRSGGNVGEWDPGVFGGGELRPMY